MKTDSRRNSELESEAGAAGNNKIPGSPSINTHRRHRVKRKRMSKGHSAAPAGGNITEVSEETDHTRDRPPHREKQPRHNLVSGESQNEAKDTRNSSNGRSRSKGKDAAGGLTVEANISTESSGESKKVKWQRNETLNQPDMNRESVSSGVISSSQGRRKKKSKRATIGADIRISEVSGTSSQETSMRQSPTSEDTKNRLTTHQSAGQGSTRDSSSPSKTRRRVKRRDSRARRGTVESSTKNQKVDQDIVWSSSEDELGAKTTADGSPRLLDDPSPNEKEEEEINPEETDLTTDEATEKESFPRITTPISRKAEGLPPTIRIIDEPRNNKAPVLSKAGIALEILILGLAFLLHTPYLATHDFTDIHMGLWVFCRGTADIPYKCYTWSYDYMPIYFAKLPKIHMALGLLFIHHFLCLLMLVCLCVNLCFTKQPVDCVAWMATTIAISQTITFMCVLWLVTALFDYDMFDPGWAFMASLALFVLHFVQVTLTHRIANMNDWGIDTTDESLSPSELISFTDADEEEAERSRNTGAPTHMPPSHSPNPNDTSKTSDSL